MVETRIVIEDRHQGPAGVPLHHCEVEGCDLAGAFFCLNDNKYFCKDHDMAFHDNKIMMNHDRKQVSLRPDTFQKCTIHKHRPNEYYCACCNKAYCSQCLLDKIV